MKNVLYRGSLCVIAYVAIIFIIPNKTIARPYYGVSFQLFYDELAPYGSWMYDREFGYVWSPYVGDDFWPYASNGNWVLTEYGNTWVSDYSWGWAPFHYGRWRYHDYYGWQWIPGTEWSPAWVAWRSGGGYYGWAPLGPGVNINVSINIGNYIPNNYWVFVPEIHICSPRIYSYCAPRPHVVNIIHQTTIINNTYVYDRTTYYCGPNRRDLERTTNRRVDVCRFNNMERPGRMQVRDGAINVYRPAVEAGGRDRVRPSRVVSEHSFHDDRREGIGRTYQPIDNNRNSAPSNGRYGESNRGNADRERGGRAEEPVYARPNNSNDGRQGNGRENPVYKRDDAPVNSNGGRRQNDAYEQQQRVEQPRQREEAPAQPQRVEQPRERERQYQAPVEQSRPQREYQQPQRPEAPSQPQRVEQHREPERQSQAPVEHSRPQREEQPQRQEAPSQPQQEYSRPEPAAQPQRSEERTAPSEGNERGERGSGRGR